MLDDTFCPLNPLPFPPDLWENPIINQQVPLALHKFPRGTLWIGKTADGELHPMVLSNWGHPPSWAWQEVTREMLPQADVRFILPSWAKVMIGEALAVNEQGGLVALNTPPAQAPPLAADIVSVLSVLEESLQPLVDIQALYRFLTDHPGAPDQAPGLLTTILDAVSAVATTASAPPAPDRPKTNVELWDDVAEFFASLKTRATPSTGGKNVLTFAGIRNLTLKKSADGTSYELRFLTEIGVTNYWVEHRIPPFDISQTNPLAPLLAMGRAVGGDQFNVGPVKREYDRPMDPLLGTILIELQKLERLILLDLIQRGRVNLDESVVDGEIGGLTANIFSRLTRVFPGSDYRLGPTEHYLTDRVELKDGRAYFIKFDFLTCTGENINAWVESRGTPSRRSDLEEKADTEGSNKGIIEPIETAAPGLSIVLERVLAAVIGRAPEANQNVSAPRFVRENSSQESRVLPVDHGRSPRAQTLHDLKSKVVDITREIRLYAPPLSQLAQTELQVKSGILKLKSNHESTAIYEEHADPFKGMRAFARHAFGENWMKRSLPQAGSELSDPLRAAFEDELHWVIREELAIHMRSGRVNVIGHTGYQFGSVTEADISPDGTHAVLLHRLPNGNPETVIFDLNTMDQNGITARIFPTPERSRAVVFLKMNYSSYNRLMFVKGEDNWTFIDLEIFSLDDDWIKLERISSNTPVGHIVLGSTNPFGVHTWFGHMMWIGRTVNGINKVAVLTKFGVNSEGSWKEITSEQDLSDPSIPGWAKKMMREALSLPSPTPSAQTVATRNGWISLLDKFGSSWPNWMNGPVAEAVYTAFREMGVYWGGFLLLGGILGVAYPLGWGAFLLAVAGFSVNSARFRTDHPNQGKNLGVLFPLMWNLRYGGAALVLAFGGIFVGGVALVVLGLVRHILYDAPRLAARDEILNRSLAELQDVTSRRIELPTIAEEVREVAGRLEPQSITFGAEDVKFGSSVLQEVFNGDRLSTEMRALSIQLIGDRLSGASSGDRIKLMEKYEGSLGVLAAQRAGMSVEIPWSKALAPVLAIRGALGLTGTPRGVVLGLRFHQLVQTALIHPDDYPAARQLDSRAPVVVDISSLMDPKASEALKKKIKENLTEIYSKNNGARLIITANGGTKMSVEKMWRQLGLPIDSLRMTFLNPASVSVNGIIDGVRLTDVLHRRHGNLFPNAPTSDDIRFNLITDDMGRFVGLSPQQIMDLVVITLQATIQITRQQIEEGLKGAALTLIAA